MSELNLDLNEVEMTPGLTPGEFELVCLSAELVQTKSGTESIKCKFKVCETGQHIYNYFNINSANEKAKAMAKSSLKSFTVHSGSDITVLTDVNQLVGLKSLALLKVNPPQNGYDASLGISRFLPAMEAVTVAGDMPF